MPGSSTALRPAGTQGTLRPGVLGTLGRACYRHRWLTLITWLVGVACLIFLWTGFGAPAQNNFTGNDPGQTLLNQHFHRQSGDTLTLAIRSTAPVRSAAVRARVTSALVPFAHAAHVTAVASPYQGSGQISADGHIAFATIQFGVPGTSISNAEALSLMHDARAASGPGVTFALGGDVVDQAETPYGGPTEGVGVLAAAIVLLIAFGSLLAMGLPVLTAVLGIGAGLSLIALLGHIFPAPAFSPIVASMIGLGVGVDYALFIVTRFREGLRGGRAPEDAAVLAMRTAGRTVLVAGTTVIIGMLGLLVLRESLMNGVAIAAAATVAMVLLGSLTLLPALLGFTGRRLARPSRIRLPRWLGGQGASPAGASPAGASPAGASPAGASPAGASPAGVRPAGQAPRRRTVGWADSAPAGRGRGAVHRADPGPGRAGPRHEAEHARRVQPGPRHHGLRQLRHDGPGFRPRVRRAADRGGRTAVAHRQHGLAALRHRGHPGHRAGHPGAAQPRRQGGHDDRLPAHRRTGRGHQRAGQPDPRPRAARATAGTGIRAYLTGPNAGNVSFANLVGQRLPWLIGVVVALSMVLLLIMFRSVTVAVKAALMNLLSISAAYGVLVLVVQDGWLGRLFGFPEKMPVTTWVPMFLFVILFGLSMDYEVFLLSRIRESYDATGDNAASVATGLARTARVITAAAAIMVVVFLSFVLGADVSVKQVGLGLAVAVLIDATVVRMVLVPAVMELLGQANWWLPRPLARILPGSALIEADPAPERPADRVPVPR